MDFDPVEEIIQGVIPCKSNLSWAHEANNTAHSKSLRIPPSTFLVELRRQKVYLRRIMPTYCHLY